ncbi:MAG: UDP-2,4-diacetamido-2,4,6-trideoxy-beta-L-altropyranose hydrolase, partial [Deltaproteobacteria bacterium]|nr:UDP-2,4-diacetamido-2,4,6-trideoxy-beta-L-altropyranose hydrolase [Deltaproteobacteria bacterium]
MNIVIRADATPAIGSGHVMRSLALAQALRNAGASVGFVHIAPESTRSRLRDDGFASDNLNVVP